MTVAIKKQLDESLRDALLALYLNKVVPADAAKKQKIRTAQNLYEYWLLDVLVSQDVPTSPVACAIASLQQYINRILMNLEPGYEAATLTPELVQTWRSEMHRYPTWAAHQKLLYFPAIYLDPTLRDNKSDNFRQLENDLNQSRIQTDAVQSAVLAYLTRFEEVANLNILNGYIDGEDFANSTYYFIAKSRSENTYFWRSLNMSQRPLDGIPPQPPAIAPKLDQPDPYAWSDWEKADVPIPDDAIERSIRPVWFNNRLFVVWAECINQKDKDGNHPQLRLSLCYKKPDNSWSTPRLYVNEACNDETLQTKDIEAIKILIGTVAVHYQEAPQNILFLALTLNKPDSKLDYTPLKTVKLDSNLTLIDPTPDDTLTNKICKNHPLFNAEPAAQKACYFQSRFHLYKSPYVSETPINASVQTNNIEYISLKNFKLTIDLIHEPGSPVIKLHLKSVSGATHPLDFDPRFWDIKYHFLIPNTTHSAYDRRTIPPNGVEYWFTSADFWFGDLKIITTEANVADRPYEKQLSMKSASVPKTPTTIYYGIFLIPNSNINNYKNKNHPYNYTPYVSGAIKLEFKDSAIPSPKIISHGSTQYIDFSNSKISHSDNDKQLRAPIRLNTVFTAEMIRRTENSLDELFGSDTQRLSEPSFPGDANVEMDFHGPYGRYFTELFLYLPWLITHRLNTEQQYEEAERWIRYVFNPSRKQDNYQPAYWGAVPLTGPDVPSYSHQAPHDPHQIALSHPVHFRKALYFLYLDILINRGDAAYRSLTPDSLSEAKLWYVRVLDLLGPRPVVQRGNQWSATSLQKLSETASESLRIFENSLSLSDSIPKLLLREGIPKTSLPAIDSPHLRLPFNPELLKRWDIAESRLYNLRHNLDIVGKPLHIPLFAAPLDPRALLGASSPSAYSQSTSGAGASVQIPHYRFMAMHGQAQSAVESVSQFGATLLSLIERKEQAQLQELQQQQAWNLAKMSVDLQTQALNIDRQNRQALLASKAIVQGRVNHYQLLLKNDVSEAEALASQLYLSSGLSEIAASASQVVAGGLMMVPNIFGFSNGGSRWEGTAHAATALAHVAAISDRSTASHLDRTAQFSRRREEWTLTCDQAQLELVQIDAQLAYLAELETATRLQLRLAESTLSQAKANYDFLGKRFTKTQLYQWLNSQFATLYRQAYDATLALCLAAEACWQYEIADFSARFIQSGAWNTTYRGLGAGEQLKLGLMKMQAEYLQRNERELEIRKTVSLRQLKSQTTTSTINKEWAEIHASLKKGQYEFELTHELFEDDYKDQKHYLRRIKTISVSLPAVVGPYENIRATLTQTASKVFMSEGNDGPTRESLRANQQIALSTGVCDNGLFTLNFNDERYLPFEYTGAISTWTLTFPNHEGQKDMLESLTDIIVHVNYTARVDGGSK
jgi:hypothetical protein